jgi:hypothetical protein
MDRHERNDLELGVADRPSVRQTSSTAKLGVSRSAHYQAPHALRYRAPPASRRPHPPWPWRPRTQRLPVNAQILRDVRDRTAGLQRKTRRTLTQLLAVLPLGRHRP